MAGRQLPSLPKLHQDAVTRRLCASAHLDEGFARTVDQDFTGDGLTALGLPLGVNLIALVRHARAAVDRRNALDRLLGRLSGVLLLGLLVGISGLGDGAGGVAAAGLSVVPPALVAAWLLIHRAERQAWAAAGAVYRAGARAEELAPAVDPAVEARLRELRRANVLPYTAGAWQSNPFVGSGNKIKEVVWQPIDVSRPADSPSGGKLTIKPFDAVDLHTFVAREMESIAGLDGLRARNRLYVLGTNVPYLGPELLPDPLGRPLGRIANQLVQAGLEQPGAGMQTYLSLERVSDGGRVIVSMHLRARLYRPSLSWEVAAYVIAPLGDRFSRVDRLPLARFERWLALARHATAATWPQLRGAARRNWRRSSAGRRRVAELRRVRREISEHHLAFDYGAKDSLRERFADAQSMGHSDRTDAQDYLQRLQQGVLIATERFLEAHNVDTGSFDKAQQVINTQTYNISGDINGPSNFGNNGQVNYGQQAQGAGGQQGGQ